RSPTGRTSRASESGGGGRATASPENGYGQTVSTLGAVADAYENVLFGRRMFFENELRNRAGTFALRIGMNWSFFLMSSRRESTHAFSAVFPCLMPMPNGASRNVSSVSFAVRSAAATGSRTASSYITASARPWLNASNAFVNVSLTLTLVFLKQFFIQRS